MDNKINLELSKLETKCLGSTNKDKQLEYLEWTNYKFDLRETGKTHNFKIFNNFIYWIDFGKNVGREQENVRPAIMCNYYIKSPICTVIPLTSSDKKVNDGRSYHIEIKNLEETKNGQIIKGVTLLEQMKTISVDRIKDAYRKKGQIIKISDEEKRIINNKIIRMYTLK